MTGRIATLAATLALLLGLTVAEGYVRETRELPVAAGALRSASEASAEVLDCLQGVQDELAGGPTTLNVRNAGRALRLCDLGVLERRVTRIRTPGAAPLTTRRRRLARDDIEAAVRIMRRMLLDARAAKAAMAADLSGRARLEAVVLSYRAFAAGDARSSALASEAAALVGTR